MAEPSLHMPTYANKIEFRYTNWRGEEHTYLIRPEAVEFGPYDASGVSSSERNWVVHGDCIERDGEPREGEPRRTFLLNKIREV